MVHPKLVSESFGPQDNRYLIVKIVNGTTLPGMVHHFWRNSHLPSVLLASSDWMYHVVHHTPSGSDL